MKKHLLLGLLFLWSLIVNAQFAGGSGTADDPYQVATADQLNQVRNYLDKHFIQTADIDLGVAPYNTGDGWNPIGVEFTGTYNGQEFSVKNLQHASNRYYVGLFAKTKNATIKNLRILDFQFHSFPVDKYDQSAQYFGGLAGQISYSEVFNCHTSGTIYAREHIGGVIGHALNSIIKSSTSACVLQGVGKVGGILGTSSNADISQCSFNGEIKKRSIDNGLGRSGGIVGYAFNVMVSDCYSHGIIYSSTSSGGIVGYGYTSFSNDVKIYNCYSSCRVTASSGITSCGGILGTDGNFPAHSQNYYNYSKANGGDFNVGVGVSEDDLRSITTYINWDFSLIWYIHSDYNNGMPFHKSQSRLIYENGNGSESSPYQITSIAQLDFIRFNPDKHYILMNDLDFAGSIYDSGAGWDPIGDLTTPFSGTIDGNGKTIYNLKVNRPTESNVGLLGVTSGATITDLALKDISVTGSDLSAGLAGTATGGTIIERSYVTGTVSGNNWTAGLVAKTDQSSTITDSYSSAVVNGAMYVGGLVGLHYTGCQITNSYATGAVTGTGLTGGLVGYKVGDIISSYYDSQTTGQTDTGKGEGKTTAEMQHQVTYTGWDIPSTWFMVEGATYPTLSGNNLAPVISATTPQATNEDTPLEILISHITTTDADDMGNPVTVIVEPGTNYTFENNIVTPAPDFFGTLSVNITAYDGIDKSDMASIQLTVNPVNDAPRILSSAPKVAQTDVMYTYVVSATDVDGDDAAMTYSIATTAPGMMISGNTISWMPFIGMTTSGEVTLTVKDDSGAETTEVFTVLVNAPEITSTPLLTATEGIEYIYEIEANDINGDNTQITYSLSNAPAGMAITGSTLSWTPAEGQPSSGDVTLTVEDEEGLTAVQHFNISVTAVNNAPVISSVAPTSAVENEEYIYTIVGTDPDNDDATLVYSISGEPSGMTLTGNIISWTTTVAPANVGPITITVADPEGLTATQTFSISVALSDFAGGTGTSTDPYLIATPYHLNNVRNYLDKHFLQIADIDLGVAPYNTGSGWEPIGNSSSAFKGVYDGGSFKIINAYCSHVSSDIGLWGFASDALFENVFLIKIDFNTSKYMLGGLIGRSYRTEVYNCHTSGTLTALEGCVGGICGDLRDNSKVIRSSSRTTIKSSGAYLGGICAILLSSTIEECFYAGNVSSPNYRDTRIGGIAGSADGSTITDSYSEGSVVGRQNVGGIVGVPSLSTLTNVYSTSKITASYLPSGGAILGGTDSWMYQYSWCIKTYYNSEIAEQQGDYFGEPKTTTEMYQQSTYENWDFTNVWYIDEGNDYPRLRALYRGPSVSSSAPVTANVGEEYTYTIIASDPDDDASFFTYALENAPSGMTITDNVISWIPTGCVVASNIKIIVSDPDGNNIPQTFTLTVTDPNPYVGTEEVTICASELPYAYGSQNLTASGDYTEVFTADNGCDSTVTLTLNVNPTFTETDEVTLCASELPYTFGSQSLTVAGNYTEKFTSVSGCDSTVTLTLHVNPEYNETVEMAVCASQLPYTFGNQNLTKAGVYTEVFTSADNCDSTVVLTLQVNPVYNETPEVTVCASDLPYTFGSQSLTKSGVYVEIFTSENNCDSMVALTLNVIPTYTETDEVTLCYSELPYTFGTKQLQSAGTYTEVFTSADGCDSTVTLTLNVNPVFTETDEVTLCASELPYTFGTKQLQSAGTYTEVFTSVDGCDSTVTLTLNVNPVFTETDEVTLCSSELPYTFGTKQLESAGTYTEVFTSADGCDSTVTLTLNVNPTYNETDEVTLCASELPYVFGSQSLNIAGTFTEVFASADGCDSTVTLTLNVNPTFTETAEVTLCSSLLPYTFGTKQLQSVGTYTEVFTSVDGCDSTVTLTLNVNPVFTETDEVTLCASQLPYTFGTKQLQSAGTYTEVFTSVDGCDSTVTLTLNVNPVFTETDEVTLCASQLPYTFGTKQLQSAGTYTEVFTSADGCDSTVTLTLNVNPVFTETDEVTLCSSDLPYVFGKQSLTMAGNYTETFASEHGCDSTVTLTLNVNPEYNEVKRDTICQGQTYAFGSQSITEKGEYIELFLSAELCDSAVTLQLEVNPVFITDVAASICTGGEFILGAQTLTSAGDYTELFVSEKGCDSTVNVTLTVSDKYEVPVEASICQGQTYAFAGNDLDAQGLYEETFTSKAGCDSVVSLDLTVSPVFSGTASAEICKGENLIFGAQTLTESGEYTELFTTAAGCDSTVKLTLTVHDTYSETDSHALCESELPYTFGTQQLDKGGLFIEHFQSKYLCDSTVSLTLTVHPEYNIDAAHEVAFGETYQFGTQLLDATDTYTEVFTSSDGCDSTVNLVFTVLDPEDVVHEISEIACGSFIFNGEELAESGLYKDTLAGGAVTGADSIVILDLTIYPEYKLTAQETSAFGEIYQFGDTLLATSGIYTRTFTSVNGCDSVVTLDYTVLDPDEVVNEISEIACGSFTFAGKDLTESGIYKDTLIAVSEADSIVILDLIVYPEYELSAQETSAFGEIYQFGDTLLATSGIYTKTFTSVNGCDSVVTLDYTVLDPDEVVNEISEIACGSFTFAGKDLTESGIYKDTLIAVSEADSIVILDLTVYPEYELSAQETSAFGETFQFGDTLLTTSGTYTRTFTSINGCDSVVTLEFTIMEPEEKRTELSEIACGSYTFAGNELSKSGIYYDSLQTVQGADSVVVLFLTIGNPYSIAETVEICEGESYEGFTSNGKYTRTLVAETGCDSVVTTTLTVKPEYRMKEALTICTGSSYRGYSEAGEYEIHHAGVDVCDSVIELDLSVGPYYMVYEYLSICEGDSYNGHTESGEYSFTLDSEIGCDSIVNTILTVVPRDSVTEDAVICEGESYDDHSETGQFVKTVTSTQTGCDSVVTLNLTVNPVYDVTETITVCEGGNYNGWDVSGDYSATYTSAEGCDSTVNTSLTVLPKIENFVEIVICQGESYNGNAEAGQYIDTLMSHHGCDSIVTTNLKLAPQYETPAEAIVNEGSTILLGGAQQSEEGTYYDTLASIHGCDSVIVTELAVNNAPKLIAEIPTQVADEAGAFTQILLGGYIQDDYSMDSDISWKVNDNKHVHIIFKNDMAEVSLFDETWTGTETVTLIATDENGAELKMEVEFTVPAKTGIATGVAFEVEVSPVPVTDICTVSFTETQSDISIRVLSIDGITPIMSSKQIKTGTTSVELDFSVLPAGSYFIEVKSVNEKFIKQVSKN